MKYIDEFRNKNLINKLSQKIKEIAPRDDINLMEVCGTHTQGFCRFGLRELIPGNIRLISGPGCPVCVSPQEYIDSAIQLAKRRNTIIATFGDMLRIPGRNSSLEKERAQGASVFVVYSAMDSLKVARENPGKKVVFLAVGFETTAPTIALSIILAKKQNLKNIFFYSSLKLIPPAMGYLIKDQRLNLAGFLCPGHVSAIIGIKPYEFIPKKYGIGCCVTGFEPLDILEGVYVLIKQIVRNKPSVANQYVRVVTKHGNLKAQKIISEVFKISDASWRGFGIIPRSGLKIKEAFSQFDAEKIFTLERKAHNVCVPASRAQRITKCRCGDVLKGLISPNQCPLFSRVCRPDNPLGPCMVSLEGACGTYYKYKKL